MPVVRVSWCEGKDAKAKKALATKMTDSFVKNIVMNGGCFCCGQ